MLLKVYRFQKHAFLLTVHGVNWTDVSIDAIVKTKTNKMAFSTEYLVL